MVMLDRPWIVPQGQNIQWGVHQILNTGSQRHKLQLYRGVLYCTLCGGWTAQSGRPKRLVEPCAGRGPSAPRMLRA
eukprot:10190513-Karenia_brevis.AAC.1